MTLSTYDGYRYFEQDYEPNDPLPRIHEIEIVHGGNELWVTFKDEVDVEAGLIGRVYHNPTVSSLERLCRATYFLPVDMVRSGKSLIINLLVGERP